MGAKKIFAISACIIAAALAAAFGLFPFFEHKINWDAVAEKAAAAAADAGCPEIASGLAGKIKYKQFTLKANAHIALFHNRKNGELKAKNFIKSCGKNFDIEEYEARLMLAEIGEEPGFAAGFFKLKYMPRIKALKNPYLQALLYYKLSLRAKNGAAEKLAETAFDILKAQPKCENKSAAFIEIAQMAFDGKRYPDIVEAFKYCPEDANYFASAFGFLGDKEFYEYSRDIKGNKWFKPAHSFHRKLKKTKDPRAAGAELKYASRKLGYNWLTMDSGDFNMPLLAYISFVLRENDAFCFYKQRALSAENIKLMRGSEFGYLSAAATFFAAMGDFATACAIVDKEKDARKKLKILNSVAPNLKGDKSAIADFSKYLNAL